MKTEKLLTLAGNVTLTESVAAETLTVAEDARITAGELLAVLTADGVQKDLVPGTYSNAVITLVEPYANPLKNGPAMPGPKQLMKAAVYVDRNGIVENRSVLAAVKGNVTATELSDAEIISEGEGFGAIAIDDCDYTIKNLKFRASGTGGDDFNGKGCAIVVGKDSKLTVENLDLETHGLTRNAVLATGNAKVLVKDSTITCYGVSDAEQAELGKTIKGMICVPWVLGLLGNNRATNVLDSADVTYENSTIRAERWGALSTDGPSDPSHYWRHMLHLTTKNCDVEIFGGSGYGSYCIGAGYNRFFDTRFKVPDYAEVIANEIASSDFFGCTVDSARFGVMWHQNQGGLLHVKDSTFNTKKAAFLVKGCYPEILVENSTLNCAEGVVLQLMESDDPGLGPKEVVVDTAVPVKVEDHDTTKINFHDGYMYNKDAANLCTDLRVTFRNMELKGDLYNATTNAVGVGSYNPNPMPPMDMMPPEGGDMPEMPPMAPPGEDDGDFVPPAFHSEPSTCYPINMAVMLENVQYAGVISAATGKHSCEKISKANLTELGQLTNTPTPVINNGVIVKVDFGTVWTVTGTCYLSSLQIIDGSSLVGADGKQVVMTVNGEAEPVIPGKYTGNITLSLQ